MLTQPGPTDEQLAIMAAVEKTNSNLQIRALAGTGKTKTLMMIDAVLPGPTLCLAFNKAIAKEMEEKVKDTTLVRTFNAFGHRVWQKANSRNLVVDVRKLSNQFKEVVNALPKAQQDDAWDVSGEVLAAARMAKAYGYVPEGVFENAQRLCDWNEVSKHLEETPSAFVQTLTDRLLTLSIKTAYNGYLDYDDQLYMPTLFGGAFPKFPNALVDEAQDLSPVNHRMLEKLKGSRIISVGDAFQAIYQFRGVRENGMDRMEDVHKMKRFNLSMSFRCPQRIVENVHWRAPWFRASATGGVVEEAKAITHKDFEDGAAIICRNNAPLFKLAFDLISNGRSVRVAGSDIGPKLVRVLRKFGDESLGRSSVLAAIGDWEADKTAKGSTTATDMAAAMRVFAQYGKNLGEAIAHADWIFKQDGTLSLMTGHKAKGLEFDTVYHLDKWLLRNNEQDQNLYYVIDTRPRERLCYVNSADIHT